ncbi:MAG: hypothetical protein ACRDYW_10120 [Acidimicrobiales bacterium]
MSIETRWLVGTSVFSCRPGHNCQFTTRIPMSNPGRRGTSSRADWGVVPDRVLRVRRPLVLVAGGLVLVLIDFRTEALDLLPDPVGWIMVATGAAALYLPLTAWLSVAAAVLSVSDAWLPFRTVTVDPVTNEGVARCPVGVVCGARVEFDPVAGWRLVAFAASLVLGGATMLSLTSGLRGKARTEGDGASAARLRLLLGVLAAGWALPPLIAVGWAIASNDRVYDPVWNGTAEYVSLVGWGLMAWFLLELCVRSGTGWATPRAMPAPSPWDQRR